MKKINTKGMKARLFLGYMAVVIIPLVSILLIVNYIVSDESRDAFAERTNGEISQIDNYLTSVFNKQKEDVNMIVSHKVVRSADASVTTYMGQATDDPATPEINGGIEQKIWEELDNYGQAHPDTIYLVLGTKYGGYIAWPKGQVYKKYDPRIRPWYRDGVENRGKTIITDPYKWKEDVLVSAVRSVDDLNGNVLGVICLDYNLKKLSQLIKNLKIGETGYVVLATGDGTILAHPKRPELNFKKLVDTGIEAFRGIEKTEFGRKFYSHEGEDKMAVIYTSKSTGWKFLGILDEKEIDAGATKITGIVSVVGAVFIAIALVLAFFLSDRFASPILSLIEIIKQTSGGDFTMEIPEKLTGRHDEIGDLSRNFSIFVDEMKKIITDLQMAFDQLAVSSEEMAGTVSTFSESFQSQSASAEEISASTEQISAGMDNVARSTDDQNRTMELLSDQINNLASLIKENEALVQETSSLTDNMSSLAREGEDSLKGMDAIMLKITESSKDMTGILKIINDISEQINLLSLNAAIEAARAGDAGRGFAVVADEISGLADKTAQSLKEINNLINVNNVEIQNGQEGITNSINLISKIIEGVGKINDMAQKISGFMSEQIDSRNLVSDYSTKVMGMSENIKNSTGEEKLAVEEISKSINDISQNIQSNAAGSEEMASGAEELAGMAENLKEKMHFFSV